MRPSDETTFIVHYLYCIFLCKTIAKFQNTSTSSFVFNRKSTVLLNIKKISFQDSHLCNTLHIFKDKSQTYKPWVLWIITFKLLWKGFAQWHKVLLSLNTYAVHVNPPKSSFRGLLIKIKSTKEEWLLKDHALRGDSCQSNTKMFLASSDIP